MKVFIAALDEGGLRKAGRKLGRSPAAISRALVGVRVRECFAPLATRGRSCPRKGLREALRLSVSALPAGFSGRSGRVLANWSPAFDMPGSFLRWWRPRGGRPSRFKPSAHRRHYELGACPDTRR